jgi:hypothetical protein
MPYRTSTAGIEPTITEIQSDRKRQNGPIPFLLPADEVIE